MQDLVGRTIGNYQIIERLGAGGMATVYRGFQASLKRSVAVKFLPPSLALDPTFRERFLREATMVASLQHPNILPVYDFGQRRDLYYIVMMLVTGGTLRDRLQNLPLSLAVRLGAQIADALGYAHSQNIVHRDVKPTNVLMARDDWALLADFGIARLTEAVGLTSAGTGIGTPEYMSPEQAMGKAVDGRADIYSLGVMLYEMTTGQLPFRGDPYAVMRQHVQDSLPLASSLNPAVPSAVDAIITRATHKEPSDRYQTGAEMRTALESLFTTPSLGVATILEPQAGSPTLPVSAAVVGQAGTVPQPTASDPQVADPGATVLAGPSVQSDVTLVADPSAMVLAVPSVQSDVTQVADPSATVLAVPSVQSDVTQVTDPSATAVAADVVSGAEVRPSVVAKLSPASGGAWRFIALGGLAALFLLCVCVTGIGLFGVGGLAAIGSGSAVNSTTVTPTFSRATATATVEQAPATATVMATPTVAPQGQPASPTAIPVGPLIFQDDMASNVNGWDTLDTDQVRMYFANGSYHIENTDDDTSWVSFPQKRTTKYSSFVYEVDVTKVDGPDDYYYGITFRNEDVDGYTFAICGEGSFQLTRYVESLFQSGQGGFDRMIEPTPHKAIRVGNAQNRLKVVARGPEITVYINDEPVGQVVESKEEARKDGTIGLIAGAGVHISVSAVRLFQVRF